MRNLTIWGVRELCIEKDWFTCGSCEQYEKMFDMVRNGESTANIALAIWLCSNGVTRETIMRELVKLCE